MPEPERLPGMFDPHRDLDIKPRPQFVSVQYRLCDVEGCQKIALAQASFDTRKGVVPIETCLHHAKLLQ
jgi:hypothetical protein